METKESMELLANSGAVSPEKLYKLRAEAEEAAQLIKEAYQFAIGETQKRVYYICGNAEYLTRDGVWKARYLYHKGDVKCTSEGILELFKIAHLVENGILKDTESKNKAKVSDSFRAFVKATAKAVKSKAEA